MSTVSEQSAQGIQSQQQEISQVATAMAQMKATVADVAGNTEVASESASSANALARRGNQDVQSALVAITRVAEEMEQAGTLVAGWSGNPPRSTWWWTSFAASPIRPTCWRSTPP